MRMDERSMVTFGNDIFSSFLSHAGGMQKWLDQLEKLLMGVTGMHNRHLKRDAQSDLADRNQMINQRLIRVRYRLVKNSSSRHLLQ